MVWVYDRQLARWLGQRLTPAQRREVTRLQGVQRDQPRVLNELLALLEELAANTIDRQLAKSDSSWLFVDVDEGGLEEVQGQDGELLLVAAVAGELAAFAEEDDVVDAVPAFDDDVQAGS